MINNMIGRLKAAGKKTWAKGLFLTAISGFLFHAGVRLSEIYRLSPGSSFRTKALYLGIGFQRVYRGETPNVRSVDILWGLVIVSLFLLFVYTRHKNAKKFREGREYGSARWGRHADILPFMNKDPLQNVLLTRTEGLTMESRLKQHKYERNKHVLVVGGSGSGKTRYFVTPNLMQMHSSYVVTDPKGTLLTETGMMLVRNGYRIMVLNTINFAKSMHYNPFAYIRNESDILKFVTILMENTKGEGEQSGDGFWLKAEQLLYCALIGYIKYEAPEEEQNFTTLLDLINACEAKEDDEDYKSPTDILFERLKERDPHHFAVRQYVKYKKAAGKTAKSILISCGARLAPFDIQEVRELMEYDEMQLDTLGDRKSALFLIMSDSDPTFNFVIAMLESQLFNLLQDKADEEYGGQLPVHVRCILDEFANLGKIPNFDKLISTIRSREISACIILQSKSQLKARYKDAADVITGNCDSQLFLGGIEQTTLKEMSEMLGKETIDMLNRSESRGTSRSDTMQYQKGSRDLMSMDELSVMDGEKCILRVRGLHPFYSYKYDILRHPNYRQLAEADKRRNTFDIEKYMRFNRSRALPLPGETFDCYEVDLAAENK